MNAIVALCHFCESHGPRVVFFTYVQKGVSSVSNPSTTENNCPACTSIASKCFLSKEKESVTYCSRQTPSTSSMELLLKQACIRSLSCEVSTSKGNALIFFGNSIQQEYVLSYTFQLKDTKARGLKRLFSIIVIMKDKMYLLNLTPHYSNLIKSIVTELENLCEKVYAKEQASCSQRALRLKREKMDSDPPRSLPELTGQTNVFAYLHIEFCSILSSAAKVIQEVSSAPDLLPESLNSPINISEPYFSTRQLRNYLSEDIFLNALYCTLVGIQVLARGDSDSSSKIIHRLELLLPKKAAILECLEYISPTESRLYSCKTNVAVPQPCSGVCRIDIVNEQPFLHWTGELPKKCIILQFINLHTLPFHNNFQIPTLMSNILKIMNEENLSDGTIDQQILSLREEWRNHAMVLKMIPCSSKTAVTSMKRSLGIKTQDETLVEYWMSNFVKL